MFTCSPVHNLPEIVSRFHNAGAATEILPFGSGHINDTYRVKMSGAGGDFVLQRINHKIFRNVGGLTDNIVHVAEHVRKKLAAAPDRFGGFRMVQPVAVLDGTYVYCDPEGNWWRMYGFIPGRSYDLATDPRLAYEGGKGFGTFFLLTGDVDASKLVETIPDFHHYGSRMAMFREAVKNDAAGRVKETGPEIAFIEAREEEMMTILRLQKKGELPLRVTHNDTKFNNILFDDQDRAISIVDLDTVMPGTILFDFGDAIRTGANTGAEDELDLERVGINLAMFEAYARGFLEKAGSELTHAEKEHLAFSARFMTCIIGLRFLTDHLNGDVYYRIHHPNHNLHRTRAQFRLLRSMEDHRDEMRAIISRFAHL